MNVRNFLQAVGNRFDIKIKDLGQNHCVYEPGYINLYFAKSPTDILHELAHFTIAIPEMRARRNYGWHYTPTGIRAEENRNEDGGNRRKSFFKSYDIHGNHHIEEEFASILGILAERNLGLNWEHSMKVHQWKNEDLTMKCFWKNIRSLQKIGLVNKDYKPLFLSGKLLW